MQITDIKIRKINTEGRMKAVVSVTFDDVFVVHDIKIIEGTDKFFIAMPSRKTPEGEYRDIAHPINADMREILQTAIIDKYEEFKTSEEIWFFGKGKCICFSLFIIMEDSLCH